MILIKTKIEIGELIQKSTIDGISIRKIHASQLQELKIGSFMLVYDLDSENYKEYNLAQTIILNKLMSEKLE